MPLERRQNLRALVSVAVEISDARGFSLHSTKDISSGGLYFDRAIPHRVGAKVNLVFTLPGEPKPIKCAGEVVNVPNKRDYGMGIRFLDLGPEETRMLEAFAKYTVDEHGA